MKRLQQAADYDKNLQRPCGPGEQPCLRCGRAVDTANDHCYWVHLLTTGDLIALGEAYDEADSQGLFPVGPTCGEKHLREYIGW